MDPIAISSLIKALKDRDPSVRRLAVIALGFIGDETALPALKKVRGDGWFNFADSDPKVVKAAKDAIEQIQYRVKLKDKKK